LLVQQVTHERRIHLDVEADDLEAESEAPRIARRAAGGRS